MGSQYDAREYPKNIEAEQVILGSILLEPDSTMPLVMKKKLEPEHFYNTKHGVIFDTMRRLYLDSKPCDIIILANELEDNGDMERAGGRMYLNELLDRTTTTASVEYHVDIVRSKSVLREFIHAGALIEESGFDEGSDLGEIYAKVNQVIGSIVLPSDEDPYTLIGSELEAEMDKLEAIHAAGGGVVGISSGYKDLDVITSGFRDSDLTIIAARTSVGKTSLSMSMMRRMALDGTKVGFFSLEMSKEQILQRLICGEGRIGLQKMRGGFMNSEDWRRMEDVSEVVKDLPIYVDESQGNSLIDVIVKSRMMVERDKIEIIFIDYLQLIEIPGFTQSRENEVSTISKALKMLARELNIPICVLSQLNREVESRSEKHKRPKLSDLRESGSLEQDADVVLFIYRSDYYNTEEGERETVVPAELIIAKQRNGPLGRVYVSFHKAFVDFYANVYATEEEEMQWKKML